MAITRPALAERLAVDGVGVTPVERAAFALTRCAVTLKIAQVRGGRRYALAGELDDARLDDDPTSVRGRRATAAGEQASDTRAAPDPCARECRSCGVRSSSPAARKIGGSEDATQIAPGALATLLALTPKARFEAVVVGHSADSGGV